MLDMPFVMNRLREIRENLGLTLEEVAAKAGTTLATIQRFEAGTRNVSLKWLEKLSKIYGVEVSEIVGGKKSEWTQPRVDVNRAARYGPGTIPIYGPVNGSGDIVVISADSEIGRTLRHPSQEGYTDVFAMPVYGDSMSPRHRPGELVYAVKNLAPAKDQDCIIEMQNGEGHLKEFCRKTDKEVVCRQLNPLKEWKKPLSQIKAIHAVVR